jgi:hypothetical protein
MALSLTKNTVENILLDTFGLDVRKSRFMLEKWNESWSSATRPDQPVTTPPSPPKNRDKDEGFREISPKFRALEYYTGRESTDRDTEKQFKSWKMITSSSESLDSRTQSQRKHFSMSPERDLDFAQASICPSETRRSTLRLSASNLKNNKYVLTSAGASWDIALSLTEEAATVRKSTESLLAILDNYPSLFSFFRNELENAKFEIEPISSFEIGKNRKLFSRDDNDPFWISNGFCIKDKNNNYVAVATCAKEEFDPSISMNLTEEDAIDSSHLPYYGSNFLEEDKFAFASKAGLLMFAWCRKNEDRSESFLASLLVLVLLEANAEKSRVSVALDCERNLCSQLTQSLGFVRTFDMTAEDEFFDSNIYDVSKGPPVRSDSVGISLFKIFPSASQMLGSALLVWMQLTSFVQEENQGFQKKQTNVLEGGDKKQHKPATKRRGRDKEETSTTLTTIENSAERFNPLINVWKGDLETLRSQLVEE